ncbi:MAG: DUF1214 domain-containing protein [Gammaproteobacteria bacterium]|nr:DUF1214 domain-containing protein [Gammaproteobacteria bacterium]
MNQINYRELLGPLGQPVATGEIWGAFADAIRRAGEVVTLPHAPGTAHDRAEGYRYLTQLIQAALIMHVEFADKDYPEFGRFMDTSIKWGQDNTDCLYLKCSIRGDASYRVRGYGGNAHYLSLVATYGSFGDETPEDRHPGGSCGKITNLDLAYEPDGSFELIVSPEPREGNWLRVGPKADGLGVRQFFYDWDNERPWYLEIERIGAEYPPPRMTAEQLDKRLRGAMKFISPGAQYWDRASRGLCAQPVNQLQMIERGRSVTDPDQHYGFGWYRVAEDEALIVEIVPPPDAHYWSFQAYNWWQASWDYTYRQSSLNGHQARRDPDGKVHLVLAHRDPAVHNWIDLMGHVEGLQTIRYLLSESGPQPTTRLVKRTDVSRHLPAGTPVIDAQTRAAILRRRRRAVWRRFRG